MLSSFRVLPAALLTLVLASPVFAAPTSENDQFRAIAALVPRKPELPVCCLKPLQPLEAQGDDVLLSFEEWKSKQIQLEKSRWRQGTNRSTQTNKGNAGSRGNGSDNLMEAVNANQTEDVPTQDDGALQFQPPEVEVLSPHFRVPLQGRYNYANSECSARVHMSHRSAKSSSAILSSKRDRYMLSPCVSPNREPHFVVVELCDDIAIDTVQLSNFEFFSGVFKDFRVSVTKTDFTKPAHEWTDAGTYRAKNVRGVQSFPLPKTLRDFYRYIRIDFLSHYGSEYYCPVSLLRVYGLTHLEQWKWDEWAAQSNPSSAPPVFESLPPPSPPMPDEESSPEAANTVVPETSSPQAPEAIPSTDDGHNDTPANQSASISTGADPNQVLPQSTEVEAPVTTAAQVKQTAQLTGADSGPVAPTPTSVQSTQLSASNVRLHSTETAGTPPMTTITTSPPATTPVHSSAKVSNGSSNSSSVTPHSAPRSKAHTTSVVSSASTPIIISAGASSVSHPPTTGGESIYRTIMNRITALENNHTLYALYLGEQMDGVRDKLRRLGEDVGRLEGIGRGQAQSYQRSLQQWEKQQLQMQRDYRDLLNRIEDLSGEIVLEKRLGIAQLCLLLAVLVFMGLTRGSRERIQLGRRSNYAVMKDWSRRHLRLSGDWANRLVRSRTRSGDSMITDATASQRSSVDYDRPEKSREPHSAEQLELHPMRNDSQSPSKVAFPEKSSPRRRPLEASDVNSRQEGFHPQHVVFPMHYEHNVKSRSRTPSRRLRNYQSQNQAPPLTPTHSGQHLVASYSTGYARPRMQRSNSHGTTSHGAITSTGHRTAKRWGRVAHLHDMRILDAERRAKKREAWPEASNVQGSDEDVFGSVTAKKRSALGLYEQKSREDSARGGNSTVRPDSTSPLTPGGETDGDQWVDTDTEMDMDADRDEDTWDSLKQQSQKTPPQAGPSNGREH